MLPPGARKRREKRLAAHQARQAARRQIAEALADIDVRAVTVHTVDKVRLAKVEVTQ